MPGPPPKSDKIKKLQGTFRRDRAKRGLQVTPLKKAPNPPRWLSERAQEKWRELAPLLVGMGILTRLDLTALEVLCATWAVALEARERITKEGITTTGYRGRPCRHPLIPMQRQAERLVLKLLADFGLTPSGRARLNLPPPLGDDPFTKFISGRKPGGSDAPRD